MKTVIEALGGEQISAHPHADAVRIPIRDGQGRLITAIRLKPEDVADFVALLAEAKFNIADQAPREELPW
jgi:hypothetical protein